MRNQENMKSILSNLNQHLLSLILVCLSLSVYAEPVLLFSDIESGPKNGWSAEKTNKGAAVSIWGSGFGEHRGTSFVTANGEILNTSEDYAVWGEYWPTQYFQRITFWLNSEMVDGEGEITVTVDGKESNPLPFTIRSGNIYFIAATNDGGDGAIDNPFDADNSNSDWIDNMQPGDIYYFNDATVYGGKYNGGKAVIWIRESEASGTADSPIALLAFPGESPLFSLPIYDVNHNRGLQLDNSFMVYSGFSIDSEWKGANMGGDHNRFIGNDVIGLKNLYGSGTGILSSGNNTYHSGDGNKFIGNAVHGGNSQSRYDHGIYLSGCADNSGAEVGWNHFYDNDFGRGPIIVVNHQDDRCAEGQVLDAHFIFNNIVDCSVQRSRAIGISDLSYDDGEEEPEPTYVYNNVSIGCGTYDGTDLANIGWAHAMYHSARGSAHFYNNTLYNSGYIGIKIGENTISSSVKNNIIHMTSDIPGPTGNHYIQLDEESEVSLSNNLFYGLGDYSPCLNCVTDLDNINNLDPMFVDVANNNFNLHDASPAIDMGTSDLPFEIDPPSYAPINRDINYVLRSSTPSIGAYEYMTTILEVEHINDLKALRLYPNPVEDSFTLEFDLVSTADISFEIIDVMGRLIFSSPFKNYSIGKNKTYIETNKLDTGMYYLRLSINSLERVTRKFTVK